MQHSLNSSNSSGGGSGGSHYPAIAINGLPMMMANNHHHQQQPQHQQQHHHHQSHSSSSSAVATASNGPISSVVPSSSGGSSHHLTYLQCPLCLDDFSATNAKLQPRLLPSCAHSLCTRCLHQQWSLQASELLHPTFLCPIDAHPVRVTQVEDIPINRVLIGLMAMMASSSESEAAFRIGAYARHRCVEEDCDQEATWHCITDEADMCEVHKQATHDGLKSNITRNHRLCRIDEKASKKGPAMCVQHHSALLLWCTECRVHACHACATLAPHSSHPQALKLLGHHLSNASLGGLGLHHNQARGEYAHGGGGESGFFSDQQMALAKNIVDEEKRMKMTMEREAKELVQTLQVIDSNELHTQQSLDTEFDNLLASLEARRAEMHAELAQRSAQARAALDARMLQLSLNHSLTNTVLEESARVMQMNPFQMVEYMDNLVVRHEKALEKYWEYAYESSLVCWFPLRLTKEPLLSTISQFGCLGIPAAPRFLLDECRTEPHGMEVVWEGPPMSTAAASSSADEGKLAAFGGASRSSKSHGPGGVGGSAHPTSISFYILHMSPLDPFDLSQEHVAFQEIYRGAHTSFRVTNLEPGQAYLFRVQAVSLMGEGVWSQKICMTTVQPQAQPTQQQQQQQQLPMLHPSHRDSPPMTMTSLQLQQHYDGGSGGGGHSGFHSISQTPQQHPRSLHQAQQQHQQPHQQLHPLQHQSSHAPPSHRANRSSFDGPPMQPPASLMMIQQAHQPTPLPPTAAYHVHGGYAAPNGQMLAGPPASYQQQPQQQQQTYPPPSFSSASSTSQFPIDPMMAQHLSPNSRTASLIGVQNMSLGQQNLSSPSNRTGGAGGGMDDGVTGRGGGGWHTARSHNASAMASRVGSPRASAAGASSSSYAGPSTIGGPAPLHALAPAHPQAHPPSVCAGWEELWKLSVILREKDVPALMRFFQPQVPASFQLLYRSSRDSPTSHAFHAHVSHQGPALLVVRAKVQGRDYVFGAYTEQGFNANQPGGGQWTQAPSAGSSAGGTTWLFSLINAYKRNLKFRLKRGAEKYAQYTSGDPKQTCMFGAHGDLTLLDPLTSPIHTFFPSSTSPADLSFEFDSECDARSGLPKFALPPGSGNAFATTMLCGGETFQCKEVEVYAVNSE